MSISSVKKNIFLLVLIIICFFAIQPLFNPGFFPIHDDEQIGRLFDLDQVLKEGQIPPRIIPNIGFGFGYPLFNFYPPLVYYVAEVFRILGFSYIDSVKIMIGLGFILSSFFMYLFSKEYLGRLGGLISAVFYVYAPYHSVDVYVRGALPEFWSFVFIPAIFWAYKKLADTLDSKYAVLAGVFNALLVITHNLVALMSSVFIAFFILFLLFITTKRKKLFLLVILSGILSFLLPSYFFIPAVFENGHTMVSLLTKELADYSLHFVYIRQFWNSPWGYGGSLYGLYDGLSFQVGKLHIIGSFLSLAVFFYLTLNKRRYFIIPFFVFLFIISLFLQTFWSKPLWDLIQPLSYIQFPWRFLIFSVFTSSFLAGSFMLLIKDKKIQSLTSALIIIFTIFFYKDYFKPSSYLTNFKDENYINQDILRWDTSIMAFEYVPKGIATKKSSVGNTIVDISKQEISKSSTEVISGEMSISPVSEKTTFKEYNVNVLEKGRLQLNIFSFPGWKVFVDGQEIKYDDNNKFKLITLDLEGGKHTLVANFTDTPYRLAGNTLTIFGFLILFSYILLRFGKIQKVFK